MLSQKQLNFGRFSIVCVDVIKHPLKDILTIFIKPADLDQEIQNCKPLLKGENKLNPDQRKKCCYKSPNSPDYSKFDITLLYKLIRNLCPSLEPKKKWGSKPTSNDMDVGDDIERIRKLRNTYFAHIELAEISDDEFRDLWSDVKCVIQRCQQYTSSKGCTTDYNKMLIDLERKTFTSDEYTFMKKRSGAIYVYGEPDIFCGKTACFEAEITLEDDVFLPVSWDRVKGMLRKQLDVEDEKYRGSDNRQLLIHNVCKDDEAGYQAVLSRNDDVKILSNKVYLRPKGDRPCLDDLNATSKEGKIYIHYVCKVSENFPLKSIKWTKNKSELEVPCNKYRGGGVADNCVEILMPDEDDKGLYTCTVLNAVGPDSKKVKLDKPSADIVSTSNSKVVCGSDTTFDCTVSGYPSPDVVKWQHSLDGTEFFDINTDTDIYLRSSSGLSSHSLLVRKAKLNEQRYYRVVVSNSIGKCNSNKLFLQVTGSKPNISEVTCSLHGNSVKLKCDVFLYDESPPLNSVYWTKGGKHIVIATNDRKYAGADKNGPSLTIYNVNCDDAGEYQLIAVNPVGETWSKVILLGVPEVLLKECIKTEDGSLWFTMAIKSVPVPHSVKWNIKENNTDTFEPINVSAAEYIGTSNTFPHPVLVIKHKEKLDNCIFEIEVKNRIGEVKRMISGELFQEELKREKKTLGTFYAEGGIDIPFSIWLSELAKKFPKEKTDYLKFLIHLSCKIEDVTKLDEAKTAQDCFQILFKENIVSPSDVITMQFLLIRTQCDELEKECIEYAKQQKAMHFYEKPPENGYRNVRFHVARYLHQFSTEDETKIRETVSRIVGCSIEDVEVNGYLCSSSFFLVLSIKEIYIERLFDMKQHDKEQLSILSIDCFKDDFEIVEFEHTADKDMDKIMIDPSQSITKSSKEYCIGDNGQNKLKQAGYFENTPGKMQHSTTDRTSQDDQDDICTLSDQWNSSSYLHDIGSFQKEISDCFKFIKTFINDENFVSHVRNHSIELKDIEEKLDQHLLDLKRTDGAIVFAGETSSGKSSIVNSFIGENILPTGIMATTARVCRVRHSEELIFAIRDENDTEKVWVSFHNTIQLAKKLKEIGRTIDRDTYVDIRMPIHFQEGNITLVDTPGIGNIDQKEVAEMMMKCLPNALAFVFVINVAQVGVFQKARFIPILEYVKSSLKGMVSFDHDDVIFLLNKWDTLLDDDDKYALFESIKEKIRSIWKVVRPQRILKFSINKAFQEHKYLFKCFREELKDVIEKNQEKRLEIHKRFLRKFINDCDNIVCPEYKKAMEIAKSSEEKVQRAITNVSDLKKIWQEESLKSNRNINRFLEAVIDQLHEYVHHPDFKSKILQKVATSSRFRVGDDVNDQIQAEIIKWEETHVNQVYTEIFLKILMRS